MVWEVGPREPGRLFELRGWRLKGLQCSGQSSREEKVLISTGR